MRWLILLLLLAHAQDDFMDDGTDGPMDEDDGSTPPLEEITCDPGYHVINAVRNVPCPGKDLEPDTMRDCPTGYVQPLNTSTTATSAP